MRVVVADDHPLYRSAVVAVITRSGRYTLVGEATSGSEALALLREHRPDVALLDLRMPELDGMEVLAAAVADDLPTRVIILSAHLENEEAFHALADGAAGLLTKTATAEEIHDAIDRVVAGESVLPREIQTGIAEQIRRHVNVQRSSLSQREQEILARIAMGLSTAEIGQDLFLSTATVKTYLQRIYEKLGVSERAAAVAEAMRRGIID